MRSEDIILIVEDRPYELESYIMLARSANLKPFGVSSFEAARAFLESKRVHVLLTDIFLSSDPNGCEGLRLVQESLEMQPHILPLIMSSHPDERLYKEAMDKGALFALKKPLINTDEILIAIQAAKEKRVLLGQRSSNSNQLPAHLETLCPDGLCLEGSVRRWLEVAVRNPKLPVVIYGETGTGKEEVAKLLMRKRKDREGELPFVSVNCALLGGDLGASLLFGHKKGAFSGAYATTQGYVGEAHGGILFLDEIHTLSLSCQQKLLRVLNDGSYSRVGDTKELYSQFQVVVASTRDLDEAVDANTFLLDLRVRLTGLDIPLAPLRERKADIPLLIELFFLKEGVELERSELQNLSDRCREYYWQGNIRQLFQCLRALLAISRAEGQPPLAENLPILKTMSAPAVK